MPSRISASTLLLTTIFLLTACGSETGSGQAQPAAHTPAADLLLHNGRVYTFAWADPDREGRPAADAPVAADGWVPDAEAVAIRAGRIMAAGSMESLGTLQGAETLVVNLQGATVIPGLVESHGHFHELGEQAERVDVSTATTTAEMAALVAARIPETAPGEWIFGGGWDEGAWADALPTRAELDAAVPDHPVLLKGRRGFGILVNAAALDIAGVSAEMPSPSGGEIVKDEAGDPTGVFLNRAQALINDVIPEPTLAQKERRLLAGLNAMARAGYVDVHHAGVYGDYMPAYESLASAGALPVRVEIMLAARPENMALMEKWIALGPTADPEDFLQVRAVKAYYDGSLGSRGAQLIEDYSDQPGHRGVAGEAYGFPEEVVTRAMAAGFQVGVHAIGDAGNRAVLDFYERVFEQHPRARDLRHRVEHAQIIHPNDFARFGELNLVASMEPGHAVEDSPWAEARVGPQRIRGGYAWRTLRRNGAGLIFNSDLSGTDYDIFYGLHSAVTRKTRDGEPPAGWYPEEAVTMEEALRAYTVWPARASGRESLTGTIVPGKWADITVLSIDPFAVAGADPAGLLNGAVLMTVVDGRVVYNALDGESKGGVSE
ncbi:MAG: amidohydrolase [Pseudomonadales bacterium]|nr:amidohydrolase [Pseudomonadales bacterium]